MADCIVPNSHRGRALHGDYHLGRGAVTERLASDDTGSLKRFVCIRETGKYMARLIGKWTGKIQTVRTDGSKLGWTMEMGNKTMRNRPDAPTTHGSVCRFYGFRTDI